VLILISVSMSVFVLVFTYFAFYSAFDGFSHSGAYPVSTIILERKLSNMLCVSHANL